MWKFLKYWCLFLALGVGAHSQTLLDSEGDDPPHSNTTMSCGGVVEGLSGLISYRSGEGEKYEGDEKCTWTIRVPHYSAVMLTVSPRTLGGGYSNADAITFYSVSPAGITKEQEVKGNDTSPLIFQVNSSVVLVDFFTDCCYSHTGFNITFEAIGELDNSIGYFRDVNVVVDPESQSFLLHPPTGEYKNMELSTFVVSRPTGQPVNQIILNVLKLKLEQDSNGTCVDKLHIYYTRKLFSTLYQRTPVDGICEASQFNPLPIDTMSVVLVLATNEQGTDNGFSVTWY